MYEDQSIYFNYDEPQPHNDPDSGPESDIDGDDDGDEFCELSKHVFGWSLSTSFLVCPSLIMTDSRSVDARDRRDRLELQAGQWEHQMPRLVEAYLDYRSRDSGEGYPTVIPNEVVQEQMDPSRTIHEIELVDLFCTSSCHLRLLH